MGAQIVGREVVSSIFKETAYGVAPGSPAGTRLYFRTSALAGMIAKELDDTLHGRRGQLRPVDGAIDVAGSMATNIAPESVGEYLSHLLGITATTYAVAIKAAANNITGVEVLRGEAGSAAGTGTLTFTAIGTTITWAESGDTAGAAVNIGAGGDFTLATTSGKHLYIRVTASALPGSDKADSVAVSAGTVYEHVFSVAGTKPEGAVIEFNLGTKINAARRYLQMLGCKIGQAQFGFPANGFATANYDWKGSTFNRGNGSPLDGTLDDYGHVAFSERSTTMTLNGAPFTQGTEAALTVGNDLDDTNYTIGGLGARGSLPDGMLMISGSITALATDETAVLLAAALAGTAASIAITLKRGDGTGTAGNESLVFRAPDIDLKPTSEKVEGPKGIRQQIEFNGFSPSGAETRFEICLRTTRAAATF